MAVSVDSSGLPISGIRLASVAAGVKAGTTNNDLVVIAIAEAATVAAVFTSNAFAAAPVLVAKQHLAATTPRYLLINSGNANAGTGEEGLSAALLCCQQLAKIAACQPQEVIPFSTGVIGEPLPAERICKLLPAAVDALANDAWSAAAEAIMTTDTVAKLVSRKVTIDGQTVTLTGMAKGSGMIHPNMATMLAFVSTDMAVENTVLQAMLKEAVAVSFNAISVDGDTSTNDACLLMATGQLDRAPITSLADPRCQQLQLALTDLCIELAGKIVRDGEGATKFITIDVEDGENVEACRQVAFTVAHSPLVKTAFFASDPNWGRILAAVGRAGLVDLDVSRVHIYLGDVCIVRQGQRAADYKEEMGVAVMAADEIVVRIVLGRGPARCRIWSCDFSYDYVRINAEYRT